MDLNYSKAMQELKKSYEQEKTIKNKNFQFQISEINNALYEKEKKLNINTTWKRLLIWYITNPTQP